MRLDGWLVDGQQAKDVCRQLHLNVHLQEIADSQTYAEVSAAAIKDPTTCSYKPKIDAVSRRRNTSWPPLLGSGYAYWTFGDLPKPPPAFMGVPVLNENAVTSSAHDPCCEIKE